MKTCPHCGERIQDVAKKCRFCREWLNQDSEQVNEPKISKNRKVANKYDGAGFIKGLVKFLYLDKNRINGLDYFVGIWLILLCLAGVALLSAPLSLLADAVGEYSPLHGVFVFLQDALLGIAVVFGVFARIRQGISRWHDLGLSGWYVLLNRISFVSLYLIFASGQKHENEYGLPRFGGYLTPIETSSGPNKVVKLDVEKSDLGKKIKYEGNIVYFKKNAKVGAKCIIAGEGYANSSGEKGDLIYVIAQIL